MFSRRASLALVVVGGVAFLALAVLLVPWHWVPGQHVAAVPVDRVFSASEVQRAKDYSTVQRYLGWSSYGVALVVALLLGLTRLGRRLVGVVPGPWWLRVAAGTALVLLVGDLVTLPFAWAAYRRALRFGLSRQSVPSWWSDQAIGFGVNWVFTVIGLLVLVALARWLPRTWPLWAALAAAALAFAGSFVYPVAVEPLFNHFTPMGHTALRSQILELARKEHVHISDVLVADASRRTTTLNAYVSGFGSTRRVVIYDNLPRQAPNREVLVVIAHELGHAKHQDVLLGTMLGACGGVVGVGLLGLLLSWPALLRRAGATGPGDPGVVPLVLALVALGAFVVSPIENTISRAMEARADLTSLNATGDVDAFVALQRRLAVHALSDPRPPRWAQVWFGTHPTALQRVGIAEAWQRRQMSMRCCFVVPSRSSSAQRGWRPSYTRK